MKTKGIYEWELKNADTGEVDAKGSQENMISDYITWYSFNERLYYAGFAIQLSDTVPNPLVDYRYLGASNNFIPLATGQNLFNGYTSYTLKYKYTFNNFVPPGSPRTIRVIGIKLFDGAYAMELSNFVSFIELSTPITQNTNQYLYVRYTLYLTSSTGLGNSPNNRFTEFAMNMLLFRSEAQLLGSDSKWALTQFLPPSNKDNLARLVNPIYTSIDKALNYGNLLGISHSKTFGVAEIPGPIGSVAYCTDIPTPYSTNYYAKNCYGYSQNKLLAPSVSRVFVHPAGRESYLFSDPAYPALSQGTISILGTPTNKWTVIGRVRITKTGDASDIVDEVVNYTAVNTSTYEITVGQNLTTGDIFRVTTTDTLPSPLLVDTDYYAINVDSTHVQLATSYANAIVGTEIVITTQGVGDHTLIRQNTGQYQLYMDPWDIAGSIYQLPMAEDIDGYIMPVMLEDIADVSNNYAEGDYIATHVASTYRSRNASSSMVRGGVKYGDYLYTVQQSRKGDINNICRWLFNSLETSVALCKFGNSSTKIHTSLVYNNKMYIAASDGLYEYDFTTPTVAPITVTVTGIIDYNIQDMTEDPITGFWWVGHATGLSKIDPSTFTATQYLNTAGGDLDGLTAAEVNVRGGQLEAYNGRVIKCGNYGSGSAGGYINYSLGWAMDDGVGWYRFTPNIHTVYGACIRKGTTNIVANYVSSGYKFFLLDVVITGKGVGSVTTIESFTISEYDGGGSAIVQISDTQFMWVGHYSYSVANIKYYYYRVGTGVSSSATLTSVDPRHYDSGVYTNPPGYAPGGFKRNLIDVDGNGNFMSLWHNYFIKWSFPNSSQPYGWDGSTWVKFGGSPRNIPKTATHTLVNGLSVDFNNYTGASWDAQFVSGDHFNFVHGPTQIKDNLQDLSVYCRNYYCETYTVEGLTRVIPSSAPYEIDIPETSDPNFRDMDVLSVSYEVFEGANEYVFSTGAGSAYEVSASTDILTLTIALGLSTGQAVIFYQSSVEVFGDYPVPIVRGRIYYVIAINASNLRIAETYADALAGTYIDITYVPSGSRSIYPGNLTSEKMIVGTQGKFLFNAVDAGKTLTLTYTYSKFTI